MREARIVKGVFRINIFTSNSMAYVINRFVFSYLPNV